MLKTLLIAIALGEAAFGLFVFVVPNLAVTLLFGDSSVAGAAIIARVIGIALLGLGVACYPQGTRQGFYGLLTYGVLITLYLVAAGIGGASGALLWPAVVIHAILCVSLVVAQRAEP